MLKVILNDLTRRYRTILATVLILILINLLVLFKFMSPIYVSSMATKVSGSIISYLLILPLLFIAINSFRKDLFENDGYLMFSIPLRPIKIFTAKFILALSEFYVYSVLTGLFIKDIDDNVLAKNIISALFLTITSHICLVLTAFFALILARILFKRSIFSQGASILVFIVVLLGSQFFVGMIDGFFIGVYAVIQNHGVYNYSSGLSIINQYHNIFSIIYNILFGVFSIGTYILSLYLYGKNLEV